MPVTITVNAETQAAAARIAEFFRGTGEGLERLSGASEFLKEWGQRIVAAFTVGAIVEFTREMINAAENLKILNEQGGFSLKMLSSLREASSKTREGFEGVSQSLLFFSRALGEAERNGGQVRQAFRDLIGSANLEAFATGGKTMDQVLRDSVDALNKIEDPARKAALASELFSRGWRDALAVLSNWKSEGAAGPITPEMAQNASEFNIKVRELKLEIEALFIAAAKELLPSLIELVSKLKELAEQFHLAEVAGHGIAETLKLMALGVAYWEVSLEATGKFFADWFETTKRGFVDLAQRAVDAGFVIANAISGHPIQALKGFATLLANVKKDLTGGIGGFVDRQKQNDAEAKAKLLGAYLSIYGGGNNALMAGLFPGGSGQPGGGGPQGAAGAAGKGAPLTTEAQALVKEIDKAFAEAVKGRRALLDQEEKDAIEKATKIINNASQLEAEITKIKGTYAEKRKLLAQQEADAEIQIDLAKVQGRRHLLEQDPFQTEASKKEKLLELLRQEHDLLQKNIGLYERLLKDEGLTPEARLAANKQLQDLQQRQAENTSEGVKVGAKGDWTGEFRLAFKQLGDEWGTFAEQAAKAFKTTFSGAVSAISDGITGLIMRTLTWGQALRQIGTAVMTQIVHQIVQMGVTWILQEVIIRGAMVATAAIARSLHAEKMAQSIEAFVASASAGAGKSGEQGGWVGVLIYLAVLAAAIGTIAGIAGGFQEGGFTGRGGDSEPAGLVHRNEFVFSAPAVRAIGVENLQALHSGAGGLVATRGGGASSGGGVSLALLNDESRLPHWARNQDGEAWVVDVVRRNTHRIQ
jgi:hypothetical protein